MVHLVPQGNFLRISHHNKLQMVRMELEVKAASVAAVVAVNIVPFASMDLETAAAAVAAVVKVVKEAWEETVEVPRLGFIYTITVLTPI
jgi:hypothetical protein